MPLTSPELFTVAAAGLPAWAVNTPFAGLKPVSVVLVCSVPATGSAQGRFWSVPALGLGLRVTATVSVQPLTV